MTLLPPHLVLNPSRFAIRVSRVAVPIFRPWIYPVLPDGPFPWGIAIPRVNLSALLYRRSGCIL